MDFRINGLIKVYEGQNVSSQKFNRAKVKESEAIKKEDVVAISDEANDFGKIMKALSSAPDVREEKVNAIKTKIENGTYDVSSNDVAKKIVGRFFM